MVLPLYFMNYICADEKTLAHSLLGYHKPRLKSVIQSGSPQWQRLAAGRGIRDATA
jgi:hypothetical protein